MHRRHQMPRVAFHREPLRPGQLSDRRRGRQRQKKLGVEKGKWKKGKKTPRSRIPPTPDCVCSPEPCDVFHLARVGRCMAPGTGTADGASDWPAAEEKKRRQCGHRARTCSYILLLRGKQGSGRALGGLWADDSCAVHRSMCCSPGHGTERRDRDGGLKQSSLHGAWRRFRFDLLAGSAAVAPRQCCARMRG